MSVYQCPRCELRFGSSSEMKSHLDDQHVSFRVMAGSVEDDLLGACHCHHRGHRINSHKHQTRS